ncbi:hypothetical protein M0R45_003645 [Rubus argutus]|uniref:ACB domain-containing protein n=1 Tax=Rubus argutus TaxID=59490 RepID=A0AAW1YI40_RUBAR
MLDQTLLALLGLMQEEFKEYADKAKPLPPTTKDADKLVLLAALYKQATIGSINTSQSIDPGFFSPSGRTKRMHGKQLKGRPRGSNC